MLKLIPGDPSPNVLLSTFWLPTFVQRSLLCLGAFVALKRALPENTTVGLRTDGGVRLPTAAIQRRNLPSKKRQVIIKMKTQDGKISLQCIDGLFIAKGREGIQYEIHCLLNIFLPAVANPNSVDGLWLGVECSIDNLFSLDCIRFD